MFRYFFFTYLSFTTLWGNKIQSNHELSDKMDLILNKLSQFEKRIESVEKENQQLRDRIFNSTDINSSNIADLSLVLPNNPTQRKSFLDKLRLEIKSNADRDSGPWVKPENWDKLKKRMSSFEVRKTLGEPTKIKSSVNPRIEQVYFYTGDLNADGKFEKGVVNFSDKRVISFESPFR